MEDGLSGIVNMTSGKIPAEFPSGGDQLISTALTNYGIPIIVALQQVIIKG
jgi:hypothetical protein